MLNEIELSILRQIDKDGQLKATLGELLPFLEKIDLGLYAGTCELLRDYELSAPKETSKGEFPAIVDLRLKAFYVKNFKKFTSDNAMFGFHTDSAEPETIIALGYNGVGKSSLYDALEYAFTHRIKEASQRGYDNSLEFISDGLNDENIKGKISLSLMTDVIEEGNLPSKCFFTPLLFCSEGDITDMSANMPSRAIESWMDYFVSLSNLNNILLVAKGLGKIEEEIMDADSVNQIESDVERIQRKIRVSIAQRNFALQNLSLTTKGLIDNNIDKFRAAGKLEESKEPFESIINIIEDNSFLKIALHDELSKLNNIKSILYSTNANVKTNADGGIAEALANASDSSKETDVEIDTDIEKARQTLLSILDDISSILNANVEGTTPTDLRSLYQDLKDKNIQLDKAKDRAKIRKYADLIKSTREELNKEIKETIKRIVDDPYFSMVKDIMRIGHFLNDGEELDLSYDSHEDPVVSITYKNKKYSPKQYFNTFRLRLFALCLKMGLAIKMMRETNIVAPIVFDDVFYASDCHNRMQLEEFFTAMFAFYDKWKPEGAGGLQLIFFTHDEQIFKTCREALHDKNALFGILLDSDGINDIQVVGHVDIIKYLDN